MSKRAGPGCLVGPKLLCILRTQVAALSLRPQTHSQSKCAACLCALAADDITALLLLHLLLCCCTREESEFAVALWLRRQTSLWPWSAKTPVKNHNLWMQRRCPVDTVGKAQKEIAAAGIAAGNIRALRQAPPTRNCFAAVYLYIGYLLSKFQV
jgi:hypothetical protein